MELPVLIEPLTGRPGFAAHLGAPFHLSAEADTEEEARLKLADLLTRRFQEGAQVRTILVPKPPPPGGWLPDDELTRDWLVEVERYRAECDAADRRRILGEEEAGP